jgi:ABC-type polar amino acid transport system ATPase subunit|tara:strand:- start:130 stop:903 length:774 start_codon:yes stop_codon:yes gene_type:complete
MPEKLLQIQNLHKSFKDLEVLKGVDLVVERGEVVVIIGRSGSGKSTLLRCINMIELPERGYMEFSDKEKEFNYELDFANLKIEDSSLQKLRTQIGMVFQQFNLWPHMTALENVLLGLDKALGVPPKEATERAEKQLEKMGLSDKLNAYPGTLSGGQQQRVALARALALEPALIMFDEATSALDAELVAGILEEMRRLAEEGMTMIVVTHEIGFARKVGDRLLFMDQGVVVEEGIPQEVLNNPQHPETQAFLSSMIWE